MDDALTVGPPVDLGIDDDPDVHSSIDRRFELCGNRLIAELVEASQELVAAGATADEPHNGVVEIPAQPLERFLVLGRLEPVDRRVSEPSHVRLAARHTPVEEHVMLQCTEQRFGADPGSTAVDRGGRGCGGCP
ncbi:MAG: hypothetical protein H0U09_01825 [Geodermatophilaceae bacterium]|nr:hypothetical protein [Geodermatophilaceae bacterium]